MVTRVYKDDEEFLENELTRLEEIFITNRINDIHGKMLRFISICNCAYIALNTSSGQSEVMGMFLKKRKVVPLSQLL